jgi:ADP-ribose pyrophosphatase YjhB (NUDIX family)
MSDIVLIILLLFFIGYGVYTTITDYKWNLKPINNFPFMYRGKEYWYSRIVATTPFVFCKNENNEYCVLANKRGIGTPDFQGLWNVPCGYLEFNVNGEENCQKEVFEETNVKVPIEKFNFLGVNTNPTENKQNVSIRYYAILDGNINDYKLNDENSEKNEVEDIKWIPLNEVKNYEWAFNHNLIIDEIQRTILNS